MNKPPKGYPVLRGFVETNPRNPEHSSILVYCPYCNESHVHGWDATEGGGSVSHREAHCPPGTPFKDKGYYIGEFRQTEFGRSTRVLRNPVKALFEGVAFGKAQGILKKYNATFWPGEGQSRGCAVWSGPMSSEDQLRCLEILSYLAVPFKNKK